MTIFWKCPRDLGALREELGKLVCPEGHQFPVLQGIPRFVSPSNYADHFGAQWRRYRLTQLDSYTGKTITRDRLRRCLGEELWNELADKDVLECGCGAGRFTEVLLSRGAKVTSIDLSSAVESNADNFPSNDNHRIAQADILHPPFAEQLFDVVVCLGVVQHTPVPEQTIAALYRNVKPGGVLVIDHYTYMLGWYTKSAPVVRACLKRLPPRQSLRLTEALVDFFLPLHKRFGHTAVLKSILVRVSPVLTYYTVYPELGDQLQREWALLDTHDSLTDWYKHFRTRGQIHKQLEKLGVCDIYSQYAGNGVEARGKRPAP